MAAEPRDGGKLFLLDKKTVAKAQLQTAILLWFNEGDPASILTLAVAANDCYNGLGGHINKPSHFQSWLSSKSKAFQKRARAAQNFLKHGHVNLKGTVPYSPKMAEILILDSIECHENIEGSITRLMQLFDLRFALENPVCLRSELRSSDWVDLSEFKYLGRKQRHVFYKELRQELLAAGLWDLSARSSGSHIESP